MGQDPFPSRWRAWLRQIEATQDDELSCSECFEQLSDYVDLELAGAPAAERLPRLRQHLVQCGVCREEYEVLRDLARLEAGGDLPSADALLPPRD
jgi:predicted anti-sigma-YlaC factor YlaD